MTIKLEQYKIFNEAASTLSFSIAARNLFISQSAVSQTINLLEKELSTTLFIRQSKGVTLTNEGKLLHQQITQALFLISDVENQLTNINSLNTGELCIGAGDTVSKHYILPYLTKFHKLYPGVKVKVLNRTSNEITDLLKTGQIDIGFVNTNIEEEHLECTPCFTINDIFVSNKQNNKTYDLKTLSNEKLILLESSASSRRYLDSICNKQGILLKPILELGAHELLLTSSIQGLGIACVIEEFSKHELENNQLFKLNLKTPLVPRTIGYAYLKRRSLSMAALKFIDLLKQ